MKIHAGLSRLRNFGFCLPLMLAVPGWAQTTTQSAAVPSATAKAEARELVQSLINKQYAAVEVRGAVFDLVVALDKEAGLPMVLACADDADTALRRKAVKVLAGWASPPVSVVEALIGASGHADPTTRSAAINALAGIKTPAARAAIIKRLSDPSSDVQIAAVTAVQRFSKEDVPVAEVVALSKDANAAVRKSAATLAGRLPFEGREQIIRNALADTDMEVRRAGLSAMGLAAVPGVVLSDIAGFAKDKEATIRAATALAASKIKDEKVPALLEQLAGDPEAMVRQIVGVAAAQLSFAQAEGIFKKLLADKDAEVRLNAARNLARFQDKEALPLLVELAQHADRAVAVEAIRQLAPRDATAAGKAGSAVYAQLNVMQRQTVLELVVTGSDKTQAREVLLQAIRDTNVEIRRRVARSLETSAGALSWELAQIAAKDSDAQVQQLAAAYLKAHPTPPATATATAAATRAADTLPSMP